MAGNGDRRGRAKAALAGVALAVALVAGDAKADFQTGNELLKACEGTDRLLCSGSAMAIAEVLDYQMDACVPIRATVGQLVDVAVKYLREHPKDRHHVAAALIITALAEAFPCPLREGSASPFLNGNDLLGACRRPDFDLRVCVGYVMAVADVVGRDPFGGWRACFPAGVTSTQVTDVVEKHLREHPEEREIRASLLVAEALEEAFPCKP